MPLALFNPVLIMYPKTKPRCAKRCGKGLIDWMQISRASKQSYVKKSECPIKKSCRP